MWAREGDEIAGAALRTPPHPLLGSTMSTEVAAQLMDAAIEADPDLDAVTGFEPVASDLARAWERRTGGTARPGLGFVVYALDQVVRPAAPPAGEARLATGAERERMIEWSAAFAREAKVHVGDPAAAVDSMLANDWLYVWDDGGPVSSTRIHETVNGVVRISFVYTPPVARRRGYARALVAEVSARALAAGAGQCMLYADAANPTTNAIYQAVGYRPVGEAREYALSAP